MKTILLIIFLNTLFVFGQIQKLNQNIYFETSKFEIDEKNKLILNILIDSLTQFKSYKISIKGNTDSDGDYEFNKKLSEQRVYAVTQYLMSKGVSSKDFELDSKGELEPIADNKTENGKLLNRRVEIEIQYIRKPSSLETNEFTFKDYKSDENVTQYDSLTSILELYKKTNRSLTSFCINPFRDTILFCNQGSKIYIKANSFKIPKECK